jgi:hypothetical protein
MTSNENLGAYAILYVIKNKRTKVIFLLRKNGVAIPIKATNMQIAIIVTKLLKSTKSFYNDFSKLLLNQDTIVGMSSSMTGSYSNVDGSNNAYCKNNSNKIESPSAYNLLCEDGKSTTNSTNSSSKSSGFINKGLSILQTAFEGYLKLDDNKTKRQLADASVKISDDNLTKDETLPPPKGLGTGAIIGISVLAIAIIGAITYVIIKKK